MKVYEYSKLGLEHLKLVDRPDPIKVLMKGIKVKGIFVGSRQMFEEMNRAIATAKLKPVIDRVFPFTELPAALEYLQKGAHFGKIVVRL